MLKEEVPESSYILTARFVLVIKSKNLGEIRFKARYVIGGHKDIMKDCLIHGAQAFQACSVCFFALIAGIFCFEVWSTDVKLACLQSAEPLR